MTKITGYGALSSAQSDDVLPVVDVHDATMAASGTTKKVTVAHLLGNVGPLSLLVPAYQYPTTGTMWAQLDAASPTVKYVVANVSSGPGTTVNSDYTTAITAAVAAGLTVLGYVDTNFGAVSTGTVQTNVNFWNSLYGVTNVFFDRVASDTGHLAYYTTAAGYVSGRKVFNHGVIPDSGYAPLADVLVVYEDVYANWAAFTPPAWFAQYPAGKFSVLVYNCASAANAATVLDQCRADGIGNAYVTDQTGGNPFGTLPAYWTAEAAQAKASFGGYQTAGLAASGDTTGVTDTANIQGLLNLGTRVNLQSGTFWLKPVTAVTGSRIQGQGSSTVLKWIASGPNDNMIKVVLVSGVHISDVVLDGNKAAQSVINYGLFISGSTDCSATRVVTRNWNGDGVQLYDSDRISLVSCWSTGNFYHGFEVEQCRSCSLANCHGYSNNVHGLIITPGEVSGTGSFGNTVTGGAYNSNTQFGVCVNSDNATVTTVAAGSNGGVISAIASWGAPFGGNGILDVASTTGFPSSGYITVAASGPTTAIVTYTGTTPTTFTGCAYFSGSPAGTVATGGAVNGPGSAWLSGGNKIIGASIVGNSQYGICLFQQDKTTIDSCYILNNGFFGLYGYQSSYNRITSNLFRNNSQAGNNAYDEIFFEGHAGGHSSVYNLISANTIMIDGATKARYAISEGTSSDGPNTVTGNVIPFAGATGTINSLVANDVLTTPAGVFQIYGIQAIQGANAGIDGAFTNVLRLFNNFPGGTTQIVNPNGNVNFYVGGNDVFDINSTGPVTRPDVATTAGGRAAMGIGAGSSVGLYWGSGVPTVSAPQGSLYLRTDGSSASTRAYVNTNGSTGWTAITTLT